MIYRTDMLQTKDAGVTAELWKWSTDRQAKKAGFRSAKLHKVFRHLHRDSYQLVGITEWEDQDSYEASLSDRECYLYLENADNAARYGVYAAVNAGRGPSEAETAGSFVVTNPYRIPKEEVQKYADMWEASKQHMQEREGFVDATLYARIGEQGDYALVSRAEWTSEELFMKQFEGKSFQSIIASFDHIFSIGFSRLMVEVLPRVA